MGEPCEEIMKATQEEGQQEVIGQLRPRAKKAGREEYSSIKAVLLRGPGDHQPDFAFLSSRMSLLGTSPS